MPRISTSGTSAGLILGSNREISVLSSTGTSISQARREAEQHPRTTMFVPGRLTHARQGFNASMRSRKDGHWDMNSSANVAREVQRIPNAKGAKRRQD